MVAIGYKINYLLKLVFFILLVAIDWLSRSGSSIHQIELSHIAYQGG